MFPSRHGQIQIPIPIEIRIPNCAVIEGIGPSDLNIETLVNKVAKGEIKEIIMALSTTMEGDTTNFYIYKRLKEFDITISTIARGVAIGDELQFADEITLGRSILNRTLYESTFPAR